MFVVRPLHDIIRASLISPYPPSSFQILPMLYIPLRQDYHQLPTPESITSQFLAL